MADSTRWMNHAAWAGVLLTFIGLALLWRTMIYTRKAADHSGDAVKAARDAVAAATRTADEARVIGQAQVRAYLAVDAATYGIYRDWMSLDLKIKNYGHSPAKWCVVHARIQVLNPDWRATPDAPRFTSSPSHEGEDSFVAAGDRDPSNVSVFWMHTNFEASLYETLHTSAYHFSVDCIMEWIDVFGEQQRLPFFLIVRSTEFNDQEASRFGSFRIVKQSARPQAQNEDAEA